MTHQDLKRTRLHIDESGKHITLRTVDARNQWTTLHRDVMGEFITCMLHYLITMSGQGRQPIIISENDKPMYQVTISPAPGAGIEPEAKSSIIAPEE